MGENGFVDLRSDTVTLPTEQMRRAMTVADLGDDCYGEDPTVNRLQELACEVLGTEAALFVPTGSMANQIAVKVLSRPGGEVICEQDCHLIHHEAGACAMLSQVQLRGLASDLGVLVPDDVRAALRPDDPYQPRSVLLAIENTHNAQGGIVWPLDRVRAVASVAREGGLPVFCDGARLFNAAVASGTAARDYAAACDMVTISLYKGLCAPMGSLVCGSRELIEESWRYRRIFGGALRQAGVVAAAGIIALESMIDRLADDHANAQRLAAGLGRIPGVSIDRDDVQMNMFFIRLSSPAPSAKELSARLREQQILCGAAKDGSPVMRLVTHYGIEQADIDRVIDAFAVALGAQTVVAATA
jgi:threonine aldolase